MLVSTVSTVRVAQRHLERFVNFHLNCGVDRMFLFFDDPNDPGYDYFRSDDRLSCSRCDEKHWAASPLHRLAPLGDRQRHNALLALQRAHCEGIEWIAHIDSDELLLAPAQDLKGYLSAIPGDVDTVKFPTLEAVPRLQYPRHFFEDIRWFKTRKSGVPNAEAIARCLTTDVFQDEYFRGHKRGKSATRVREPVAHLNIHEPAAAEGRELHVVHSPDAFLLHFDCCTFEEWKLKWLQRHDGTGIVTNIRRARRRQGARFLAAYESGSPARLRREYRRQYLISEEDQVILRYLGLLRRIELREGSFESSRVLPTTGARSADSPALGFSHPAGPP